MIWSAITGIYTRGQLKGYWGVSTAFPPHRQLSPLRLSEENSIPNELTSLGKQGHHSFKYFIKATDTPTGRADLSFQAFAIPLALP